MKTFEEAIEEVIEVLGEYKDGHPMVISGGKKLQAMMKTSKEIVRIFRIVKNNKKWDGGRFAVVFTEQQKKIKDLKAELKKCRKGGGDTSELRKGGISGDDEHNDYEPKDEPRPKKTDGDIFRIPLQ